MSIFRPRIGEIHPELRELRVRSEQLGYEDWGDCASDLLGKPGLRREISHRDTARFLNILRQRTRD